MSEMKNLIVKNAHKIPLKRKLTMIRGSRAAVGATRRVVMIALTVATRARVAVTGSTRHGDEKRDEMILYAILLFCCEVIVLTKKHAIFDLYSYAGWRAFLNSYMYKKWRESLTGARRTAANDGFKPHRRTTA